jgi:hypothetical protein
MLNTDFISQVVSQELVASVLAGWVTDVMSHLYSASFMTLLWWGTLPMRTLAGAVSAVFEYLVFSNVSSEGLSLHRRAKELVHQAFISEPTGLCADGASVKHLPPGLK